jgi:hypothetical protein
VDTAAKSDLINEVVSGDRLTDIGCLKKQADKEDPSMLHCRILPKASLVLSLLILLGLGYIFFEEQANANSDDCTLKSVKGAFGATFTGTITPGGAAPPGPFAAVARIVCDGKGTCHGEGTQSLNGAIVPFVDMGATYTVNPDCTGSITVDLVGGPTINFNFIIVDRGKELRSIQTDPNTVITGNLRQQ